MKKKFLVVAAGAMAAVALTGCGKTKINLDEYVELKYEGYDTIGTAYYEFDYKHFERDFEDSLKLTKEGEEDRKEMKEAAAAMNLGKSEPELLATFLKGELDKSEGLSNGDEDTFKWDIDDDQIQEYFKVELTYSDITGTVEGLQEAQAFDPFDGYNVSFTGTAPDGRISVENNVSGANPRLNYEFDKTEGLSNGDTVKITVSAYGDDVVKYCVENYGMIPTVTEKEYTVEGLPSYAMSAAEISDETLGKMQKQCEDIINTYVASDWAEEATLAGATYIGNYFMTPKAGVSSSNKNQITMVYKVDCLLDCGNSNGSFKGIVTDYYTVTFYNLMILADGTQSLDLSNYNKPYASWNYDTGIDNGWWGTLSYRYYGYQNLDNAFNDFITKNVEKYNYEDNVEDVETSYDDLLGEGEAEEAPAAE